MIYLVIFLNYKNNWNEGGRTADEIVNWLLKKTGPAAKAITSVAEAKEFAGASDVAVLGLFQVGFCQHTKAIFLMSVQTWHDKV